MELDTPEGKLKIGDDTLTFEPSDDSPVVTLSLSPIPDYSYERGIYGVGTLVIGEHQFVLQNEQASTVVEELRRPRAKAARKSDGDKVTAKSDSDKATAS